MVHWRDVHETIGMWQSVAVVGQDNQLLHDTKQEAMAASNRATENVEMLAPAAMLTLLSMQMN